MISVPERIKELYHQDHAYKNIRIHFPNGERADICNDLIVKDSVSFTESLCSQNQLKFGLCEASIFECEVVGVGNIKGATIEVSVEIECKYNTSGAEWKSDLQKYVYSISYGTFVVDSCKRQADMNHRKIIAYGGIANIENDYPKYALELFNTYFDTGGRNFTYNPYAFLFALSSLQFKLYSNDIFDSTTTSGTISPAGVGRISNIRNDGAGGGYFRLEMDGYAQQIEIAEGQLIQINREINYDNLQYVLGVIYDLVREFGTETTSGELITKKDIYDAMSVMFFPISTTSGGTTYLSAIGGYKPKFPYVCYPFINSIFYEKVSVIRSVTRADIIWIHDGMETLKKRITIDQSNVIADNEFTKLTVKEEYESLLSERLSFEVVNDNSRYHILKSDDYNAQETINSIVELRGEFANAKRPGNCFSLINIKRQFGLNPETDLYPGTDVYPEGVTGGLLYPHEYESCWYDDEYTQLYGKVVCKYKPPGATNTYYQYELYLNGFDEDSDATSYLIYDLSENIFIKGRNWAESDIQSICEIIADNLEGVSYMPVEFKGLGLPYVEAGDTFEILTRSNDSITTIVLNRTLTGEMTLKDTYKSV